MNIKRIVDVKGLACPLPIVKTKKAITDLNSGEILEVLTTDKGAKNDLTAWAKSTGHKMVDIIEENDVLVFHIKKG